MCTQSRFSIPLVCIALLLFGLAGCNSDDSTRVSGSITFNGKPVPAGKVYILPDGAKNNSGPSGFADIKDGKYDTKLPGGHGAPKGPVIFAVEGIEPVPPAGAAPDVTTTVLFPRYEFSEDLNAADSKKDIEVPASAVQVIQRPGRGA